MANKKEKWQEIANRGLQDNFDPETRAKFDEAVKRGLISIPNSQQDPYPDVPTLNDSTQNDVPGLRTEESNQIPAGSEFGGTMEAMATMANPMPVAGNIAGGLVSLPVFVAEALGLADEGAAADIIRQFQQATEYKPKTQAGQNKLNQFMSAPPMQAVAKGMDMINSGFETVAETTSPEFGAILKGVTAGTLSAAPIISGVKTAQTLSKAAPNVMDTAKVNATGAIDTVKDKVSAIAPTRLEGDSAGAASVDAARLRQENANQLPIPIKLTKGQATQDFKQQQFERETAKTELGDDLRTKFTEDNLKFNQNLDAMIDQTGTKFGDDAMLETGDVVTKALAGQIESSKSKIREAYKSAEQSSGANDLVNLEPVSSVMNEMMASAELGGIMYKFQNEVNRLKIGNGDFNDGSFAIDDMTVLQAERLRQFVNANIDPAKAPDVRIGSIIKEVIDKSLGESGGEVYNRARRLRANHAKKFENKKLISDLTSFKRGTTDRTVALEKVVARSVNQGSKADLVALRRQLQKTEDGKIAFNELAAQAMKDIKNKSTGGVGRDEKGNPFVSPAKLAQNIRALDQVGKLDVLFGKKGADDLRTLVDVARDVYVSQPGAVNHSNTSTALAAALDMYISAQAGMAMPVTTGLRIGIKKLRDQKVKKKVKQAINFDAGENK